MMNDAARVAVVTGASSGIGLAIAKSLAQAGWNVIGTGRDPGRIAAAESQISDVASGNKFRMLRADLSLFADARRVAGEIALLCDHIDVLFNNAGGMASA